MYDKGFHEGKWWTGVGLGGVGDQLLSEIGVVETICIRILGSGGDHWKECVKGVKLVLEGWGEERKFLLLLLELLWLW